MRTRFLLSCGAVGGPLFVVAFLVEGAVRNGYDPVRHPVSSLALGDDGWTQVANFIVTGLLMLAFAFGVRIALRPGPGSTWGPALIMAYAIGLVGAGVFATDPVSGYPPGTAQMIQYTSHGALHDLFSIPVFVALPAACFVLARRFRRNGRTGWAFYSVASGVAFLITFVLASLAFGQMAGLVEIGGVLQRASIMIGWGWLTLLAIDLLRPPGATHGPERTGTRG
jgi:hypothetical membrane protein